MIAAPIRKAVVPLAGLGTRHFPASHAVKKELFPVVGPDGISRPLLHYHLTGLVEAGIREICLVVQPGDEKAIAHYLAGPEEDYLRRLDRYPALADEARLLRELTPRIVFAVQHEQLGYGHAVHASADFTGGEPFLLCLGDHLFRGSDESPYRQLAACWARSGGRSVSAVNRIGPGDLKGYGTIAGRRLPDSNLIEIDRIVEKPDVATARNHLRVDGLPEDVFLGWFGLHLLAPSIHDILAGMIRDGVRDNGEFQLTRAQEIQRGREGCLAVELDGAVRFDFGEPDDFLRSLLAFRRPDRTTPK